MRHTVIHLNEKEMLNIIFLLLNVEDKFFTSKKPDADPES